MKGNGGGRGAVRAENRESCEGEDKQTPGWPTQWWAGGAVEGGGGGAGKELEDKATAQGNSNATWRAGG